MIGRLTGILLEKNPPQILLDVQGLGVQIRRRFGTLDLAEINTLKG